MGYIDRGDNEPETYVQFADHFEWDGPRWLYYGNGWKAPVPLSEEEYNRAIQWYENGTLAVIALSVTLVVALMFVPILWVEDFPGSVQTTVAFLAVIFISAAGWEALKRIATRPFSGRAPVGAARDRAELKRRRLASISWFQLFASIAISGAFLALAFHAEPGRYLWVVWAMLLLQSVYQAYHKWRSEGHPAASTSA